VHRFFSSYGREESQHSWALTFLKNAARIQKALKTHNQVIENSFQTNGILIDEEWCRFFKEEGNWLIGISLDGTEDIHDNYRFNYKGDGTFTQVMTAIDLFKKFDVPFNILSLLTDVSVKEPEKYGAFSKRKTSLTCSSSTALSGMRATREGDRLFSQRQSQVGDFYIKDL
jgi:sulfatase maturation enzyme AslB (radical SAM superfamily)